MIDHKLLLGFLKADHATLLQVSASIKRLSLFLSVYEYTLVFRTPCKAHVNADALSRLPLPIEPVTTEQVPEHLGDLPVTADDVCTWTNGDPKVTKVPTAS